MGGMWIQQYFHLAIPGSVIGLFILFILLMTGVLKTNFIKKGANFMLDHLVLFFIPAMVGIVNYLDIFTGNGLWLIMITVLSTLIVLVISGKVSEFLVKKNSVEQVN